MQGHLHVPAGSALTVEPGVEVRFNGAYALAVDGALDAQGTASDSILFTWHTPGAYWAHIQINVGAGTGTHLAHCRIEHSDATVNVDPYAIDGGGIYTKANATPLIEHCTIADCHANRGGGIWADGSAEIRDCTITRCSTVDIELPAWSMGAGGGAFLQGFSELRDCLIQENDSDFVGGGISVENGTVVVTGNTIRANRAEYHGGGLACEVGSGAPEISHNLIVDNEVYAGGGDGGGVYFWNTTGVLFHGNTIAFNRAPRGAGMIFGRSTVTVERSIIALNAGVGAECFDPPITCDATFDCVCSFGNTGGDGLFGTRVSCFSEAPGFCDVYVDDYSLCSSSPCAEPTRPCGLIGALPVGCGDCDSAVRDERWGSIKALYR